MYQIGRNIAVAQYGCAVFVIFTPVFFVCGISVNGKKGRCGKGVNIGRVRTELSRKIHPKQGGRRLVILRKTYMHGRSAVAFQPFDKSIDLR